MKQQTEGNVFQPSFPEVTETVREREERAKWGEAIFNWSRSRSGGSDDITRQLTGGVGKDRELLVSLLAVKVMYLLFYYNMDEKTKGRAFSRRGRRAKSLFSRESRPTS